MQAGCNLLLLAVAHRTVPVRIYVSRHRFDARDVVSMGHRRVLLVMATILVRRKHTSTVVLIYTMDRLLCCYVGMFYCVNDNVPSRDILFYRPT